jgi:hypothetical protein
VALHWGKAAKGGHSDDIERPPRPHDAVCEVLPAEAEAMYQRIVQGRVAINVLVDGIATVQAN